MNVWRWTGAVVAVAVILWALFWPIARAQEQFPCYPLEVLLATASQKGDALEVVSGWKGAALARIHKERSRVRYELTHPVRTVVLIRERTTGNTLVLLQIGGSACGPLPFDASSWNGVVMSVWGRGA